MSLRVWDFWLGPLRRGFLDLLSQKLMDFFPSWCGARTFSEKQFSPSFPPLQPFDQRANRFPHLLPLHIHPRATSSAKVLLLQDAFPLLPGRASTKPFGIHLRNQPCEPFLFAVNQPSFLLLNCFFFITFSPFLIAGVRPSCLSPFVVFDLPPCCLFNVLVRSLFPFSPCFLVPFVIHLAPFFYFSLLPLVLSRLFPGW